MIKNIRYIKIETLSRRKEMLCFPSLGKTGIPDLQFTEQAQINKGEERESAGRIGRKKNGKKKGYNSSLMLVKCLVICSGLSFVL